MPIHLHSVLPAKEVIENSILVIKLSSGILLGSLDLSL